MRLFPRHKSAKNFCVEFVYWAFPEIFRITPPVEDNHTMFSRTPPGISRKSVILNYDPPWNFSILNITPGIFQIFIFKNPLEFPLSSTGGIRKISEKAYWAKEKHFQRLKRVKRLLRALRVFYRGFIFGCFSSTPSHIELIDHWLRTSCSNYQYHVNRPFRYSWVKKSVTSVKDLVENCRDGGFSACSMSVPTVGVLNKDGGNGVAYRTPFAVSRHSKRSLNEMKFPDQ